MDKDSETVDPGAAAEDTGKASPRRAVADAYPVSLRLRAAPERRLAVGLLWQLQEDGIPGLYLGRVRSDDGTPSWAVLQGHYSSAGRARQARDRLSIPDAIPVETPFAVHIPVANTGDAAIQGYLREAGYWPYSVPESPSANRLLVGAFETRAMADSWRQQMETRGFEARVVTR